MSHDEHDGPRSDEARARTGRRSKLDAAPPPPDPSAPAGNEREEPRAASGGEGQLDATRDEVDEVDDALDGELLDEETTKRRTVIASWSGQLPHPQDFERYEQVLPGAADRILALNERRLDIAAKELDIDADRERTVRAAVDAEAVVNTQLATADASALKLGQWLTWSIAAMSSVIALIGLILGYPAVATTMLIPALQVGSYLVRTVGDTRRRNHQDEGRRRRAAGPEPEVVPGPDGREEGE